MKRKTALIVALVLAIGGMIMSGYLSYYTLWGPGCTETIISCGGPKPILIFGLPTCVYGFFMYLIVAVLAVAAMQRLQMKSLMKTMLAVAIVGVGFSGYLSYYELFIQDIPFTDLPACVYGLVFYILILAFVIIGLRSKSEDQQIQMTA